MAHAQPPGSSTSPGASDAPAAAWAPTVQGLTVTARTPQTQILLDRKVYSLTTNLQATTGTAADVLGQLPSVTVDADGNPSIRGDADVTVLIDGKPSAQFSGPTRGLSLQQLSADDIDHIEVLTTPPAQYKAEGSGGIINIVMKKRRRAGLSGSAQLSFGNRRRYVFDLHGAYNVGRLRLSGAFGLRQEARVRQVTDSRLAIDPASGALVKSTQFIDEHTLRHIPTFEASADYDFDAKQTIGASASSRQLYGGDRFFNEDDASGPPAGPPDAVSERHTHGHEWAVSHSEGVHFDEKLGRPRETLRLAFEHSVTREREHYLYRDVYTLPPAVPRFSDLRPNITLDKDEFSADYDLPLASGSEVKAGYDLEIDRNGFDNIGDFLDPATGQASINPAVTDHFRYRQRVDAAYAEYQAPFGRWRMQAGARIEASAASYLLITGNERGGRRDFGAYPSLHLERGIGQAGKLTLSLARRITRPGPEALNPFANSEDIHNLKAGNPNLAPEDSWIYEIGYDSRWGSVSFGAAAYYRFDRNSLTQVVKPVAADVVLITQENLPKTKSAGLEFEAGAKFGKRLTWSVSGDLFRSQIDARALGASGLRSTSGVNLKASADFHPDAIDTLQVAVSQTAARLTPQGSVAAIRLVNLGFRRQLRPGLALVATLSDVFDTGQRFHRLIAAPQLRDDYLLHQLGRVAFVDVVYSLGGERRAKASEFEYGQQ
ncbi:MAG TPA: TonB-dependent receptor [Caulobacteraceae bacterium]|nr:TonB-dependent receptor [Caulobacteraceae bacterium]